MTTQNKNTKTEELKLRSYRLANHQYESVKKLSKQFTKSRKEKTSESQVIREAIEAYVYQNS